MNKPRLTSVRRVVRLCFVAAAALFFVGIALGGDVRLLIATIVVGGVPFWITGLMYKYGWMLDDRPEGGH